jgi:hypothetical protein
VSKSHVSRQVRLVPNHRGVKAEDPQSAAEAENHFVTVSGVLSSPVSVDRIVWERAMSGVFGTHNGTGGDVYVMIGV